MRRRPLNLLPALSMLLCAAASPTPTRAATEREVSFAGAGGARLSGTLVLPEGANANTPVPAVVLVAGSGPTDRNGNQPPFLWTGLLKQLADVLGDGGVASLRYDKRGMYRSGRMPKDRESLARFVEWEKFVGDVAAARDALAAQSEVDAGRVALVGHSEGGLLVMRAAALLHRDGRAPAAIVLLATPGRPLGPVLRDQLGASFRRLGLTDEASAALLEDNDRIVKTLRELGEVPADVPPSLAPLYPRYAARFLRAQLALDPAALAARLPGPVLVVQGDRDRQVSAERDAPPLVAALKGRPGSPRSDLLVLPGASHNLKKVQNEGDQAFFGPVVPELRKGLAEWLNDRFASK